MARDAASCIQARQMRNYELDTIRLVIISFLVCFMILPILTGSNSFRVIAVDGPTVQNEIAADGNLLTISITAQSDLIAPGNVSTYRGFAYADDGADYLRFVDPINGITLNQTIESGILSERTLTGADIDDDGSTEFLILNDNTTAHNLLVVDFNDVSTTSYNISMDSPSEFTMGDFDGDSNLDVAIFGRYGMVTLNLQMDQVLGNYSYETGDMITCATVGRFLEPDQDSIALGIWATAAPPKYAYVGIIAGNCSLMRDANLTNTVTGIAPFQYGSGLQEVATLTTDGNLTVLSAVSMNPVFNTTILPDNSLVWTGFFNNDNQEDLFVVPSIGVANSTYFLDGMNGSLLHTSDSVYGGSAGSLARVPPSNSWDTGDINADNLTDIALLSSSSNPSFLSGADGSYGFTEPTISGKPNQVIVHTIDNDSKEDIIILDGFSVYVIISDTDAPVITPEQLSPPHPTLHDPYIEIEVGVEDNTSIIAADMYLRYDNGNWTQPVDELQHAGTQYFAFLVGMPEGNYDYYLVFQDIYLNIGTLGNQTNPLNFTVSGHLAWSASQNQDSQFEHHLMDIGNATDGSEVIYILDSIGDEIWLEQYSPRGENQTLGLVADRTFSDYWVYTGMMDGDNILDPIVILHNATALTINVSVYHGSTGSFWFTSQLPLENFTTPQSPQVYDCDNDGIDELFFVSEHRFDHYVRLFRMRSDKSWTNVNITGENAEWYGLGIAKTVNENSVEACVTASTGFVDILNATSMNLISSHNVTSNDHIFTAPVGAYAFHNGSEPYNKFMLYMYFLDMGGYSSGFHVFDATTPRINETTLFNSPNNLYISTALKDVDNDNTDDIIAVNYVTGDLTLFKLADPVVVEWNTPLGNSEYLSSVIVDFDGDGEDEVGVFTKEDETLRVVSLDGVIERSLVVGMGYGSMKLSNIDLGYGEEIVAYPLIQTGVTKIGVIRDIDLIRRLNASLSYSDNELMQSELLSVHVDVTNIYSEIINDAEVYVTIHYLSGTSIVTQTQALIFDTSHYSTVIAATWPIGIANISLSVSHPLYDEWNSYYSNALTILSELDVAVYTKDVIKQNGTFSVNIDVTDSLGSRVPDASVMLSVDGTDYSATYIDTRYQLTIPNIDLGLGEYEVNATVTHPYANRSSSALALFRIETENLMILNNIPTLLEQDDELSGWINITDSFGNPIDNALVEIISTGYEFEFIELVPGCYYLNTTATMRVGNHSFTIYVDQDFVQGTDFGEIHITVMGDLSPSVLELPTIQGGELFNVTVFLSDIYGAAPSDAWVIVDLNGLNITAAHLPGGKFTAQFNASYAVGVWTYTVYYGSDFSHTGQLVHDLTILSSPRITVNPSENWRVNQTESTIISVQVNDWLQTPIEDASVSLYVRGTTYTLDHIVNGLYRLNISTIGWQYGPHAYYLTIEHEYMHQLQYQSNITVIAKPTITISTTPEEPEQFGFLIVTVDVADEYDNPISNLTVTVRFNETTLLAEETSVRGRYVATFDVGLLHHDYYDIAVKIEGDQTISAEGSTQVYVEVAIPELSLSSIEIPLATGLSLFLSLLGMILFVKVSSVISTSPRKTDDVQGSIRQLDRIYGVIIAVSGFLFIHSWVLYTQEAYAYALIESIILLGSSVLLYGLWLYRDAYSSILQRGNISRGRVALGVWHLFLVPFMVLLIFFYGGFIELFQRFIIEVPPIVVGDLPIIPLLATILGTYLSSIVIVVVSFYREIRKGLKRIDDMAASGTPKNVIDEEQALLIGRTGSSIRIKFLMFLMILGATTIMQLDFLRSYSMAAIILIPVVFLIFIPFISSRLVKGFPRLIERIRGNKEGEILSVEDGGSEDFGDL
ncbi:MAG: hypothetical protein ACFFF4_12675 [Candidatus Thorarchaeota archaeon]